MENTINEGLSSKRSNKFKFALTIALIAIFLSVSFGWLNLAILNTNASQQTVETFLPTTSTDFIPQDFIEVELVKAKNEQTAKLVQQEKEQKIQKVEDIFAKYNSPMKGYGYIIVEQAEACGGDYKILVAIAGNESGFGRVPYKLYNPFGYLDGRQYSGWEESLSYISCQISKRFIKPCNGDLNCIVRTYAGPQDDKERWVKNITYFINKI